MRVRGAVVALAAAAVLMATVAPAMAWTPLPVEQDPLVFMPGSQPGNVQGMDNATRCENCHSGYNPAVEPGSNWRGSMMAQAGRDPLWLSCLTVGAQDSIWAVGTPNATDICIRCHAPGGWLGGRSDPTNTSMLAGNDFEGVGCDFCHRNIDPYATNGQPDVPADTGTTATAAQLTYQQNLLDLSALTLFDGSPFLDATTQLPVWYGVFPAYRENGAGQYFVAASSGAKYGPFNDAVARHQFFYSRYHKSKEFCHTCHDVSNPVLENALVDPKGTTKFAPASYFHVERTSSEFLLSAYGAGGSATTSMTGVPFASKCQDCHMRDVTGSGCNKSDAPVRPDLPLHDLTGGNAWMGAILASTDSNWTGYDPYNYAILSGAKYAGASIDVRGISGTGASIDRGVKRATDQLRSAASLSEVANTASSVTIRVRNNTGHKLISGFPEGRRMFLNVKWYDGGNALVGEVNPYAPLVKTTDAQGNDVYVSGGDITAKTEELVWEAEMSSPLTGESKSFHFALATSRHKDNRIPPKGFRIAEADARISQPVWNGVPDPAYFTAAEYAGGYDEVTIAKPAGATSYIATLYYQTTSKDYVKFLRDEVQGYTAPDAGTPTLVGTGAGGDAPYLAQSDPFFGNLKGWGAAIWDLWVHNGGAAPIEMAVLGAAPQPPTPITVDPPTNTRASYSRKAMTTAVTWNAPATGANGYNVYRSASMGGPYTKIGTVDNGATTSFTDAGPFSPGTYYYVVTTYKVDKTGMVYESAYSNEASARVR